MKAPPTPRVPRPGGITDLMTCAAALALICGTALAQPASVRLVNHAAPVGGNGLSWPTAYNDLQDALADAHINPEIQQIWVAQGVYRPAADPTMPNVEALSFRLRSGLALYGGFAGTETQLEQRDVETNVTTLSGLYTHVRAWHVVLADQTDAATILDGLTITGGYATQPAPLGANGAGILIRHGALTVRNCIIKGNTAFPAWGVLGGTAGGGVYIHSGTAAFENCLFESNSTYGEGGAVFGDATFTNCRFERNSAFYSGGAVAGTGTFTNCAFIDNTVGSGGGGAVVGGGTFTDCTFHNNRATLYGASVVQGSATFLRCTFTLNYSDMSTFEGGSFSFTDCHLDGNSVSYGVGFQGASITAVRTTFHRGGRFSDCDVDAVDCIFTNIGGGFSSLRLFKIGPGNQVRLVNSRLRGNTGIAQITGGSFTMINSTAIENTPGSWTPGAAIRVEEAGASATIHNSILWNNGGQTEAHQIQITAGTLDIQNSCIQGWTGSLGGTGNYGFDPMFADADGRLAPGSWLIDAGNNALVPPGITQDLDGNPRFHDDPGTPNNGIGSPPVDIGAFEFQGETCYANCTGSTIPPHLSVDDFTCFIERFSQGHPLANCDGSTVEPILTVDDFTCFINAFAAGCP